MANHHARDALMRAVQENAVCHSASPEDALTKNERAQLYELAIVNNDMPLQFATLLQVSAWGMHGST
jgi:hypothetical protein